MKVLQLVTYPTVLPRHGGQIRVMQIRQWLEAHGAEVQTVSVSEPSHDAYSSNDLIFDPATKEQPYGLPFCTDYLTAQLSDKPGRIFEFVRSKILAFKPDYIFLEQPWLWPTVQKMIGVGEIERPKTKIVYSSQNLESATKKSILLELGLEAGSVESVTADIGILEQSLCQASDWVVCVTETDAKALRAIGASRVTVCPNGVARRSADPELLNQVNKLFYGRKYLIYIGSAYPPNAAGFWELMGPSLAMFNPDEAIALVGGLSDIVDRYAPPEALMSSYVNGQILKKFGKVSDEVLEALIYGASGFILPIMSGGGSNLKTAEAIASGLPVVASPVAMRGYEQLVGLHGLDIAADRGAFVQAALRILRTDQNKQSAKKDELERRATVYWEHTLANLQAVVAS